MELDGVIREEGGPHTVPMATQLQYTHSNLQSSPSRSILQQVNMKTHITLGKVH